MSKKTPARSVAARTGGPKGHGQPSTVDISAYTRLEPLSEYAARRGFDAANARREWARGKRWYLEEGEEAAKIGAVWVVLKR